MDLINLSKRYLLNETENKVLACVLEAVEHGETKINIRDIAQKSYVSTTTVVKLAKKLGYHGYSDMIYSLLHHAESEQNASSGIDLKSILEEVDESSITAFAEELYNCRKGCIFILALGLNNTVAAYLMRRLSTLGILAYDGSPVDIIYGEKKSCATIVLSKSGETKDLTEIAVQAKAMGHCLYTVTGCADSTLAQISDRSFVIKTGDSASYDVPDFFIGRTILFFEYVLSKLLLRLREEKENE